MYKIAENNPNEILQSIDKNNTSFTKYCDLNYTCIDDFSWTFNCADGLYHRNDNNLITETKDNFDLSISQTKTLSEIKEAINSLRDNKALWFNYDNHFQRFSDADITKIKLMREGLTIQPLFDPSNGQPIYEEDGITQKQGKLFSGVNWKYPKMDINGDFIQDEYEWVMVSKPEYFTYMLGRGGLNMTLCFEAQRLTLEELTVFDEAGGDLSTFNYETKFNKHYDTLVAPYL